ncbi:UDP-N-acetylmuramoyl-tripeptide--D-alanyl-D-alanine ligase [Patescibacteria group bacterium]|nr:UDP-N-acetylmuramoyl-tripeptide--D-alanyl-D-alanine ligase [Patescibacteria group bacterium]MBU0879886.1 UDP-N-acetylmuramoyl-tripeptide--D-alanyl-D-alanine ligase [Patescibacteria group bacterium]MBU0880435.1 UDP-N-acetylmuramoyl-tripeptide--D-alanyl-D-alanine ligase [Patescibacteria group bacterium]MBU1783102.1 UDP-N-acetylmuramoyl-tripeptide--D-alanyl-D-alanine ligase [Patescibacteria group bacterium]MBU1991761.1 UDP-N-acetylmuramoyl-tripeptide--D-alanyl-D-alanine ligase [Patescibacteria 
MLFFLILIFLFLWLVSALVDYSEFCYFWQLKEYRLDRFKDFLSTKNGKKFLFSYSVCWRPIILFVFCCLFTINGRLFSLEPILLLLALVIDLVRGILLFKYKRFKYPKITFKSVAIVSISLFVDLFLYSFLGWAGLSLLVIACRWLIISSIVMITKLPTKLIKIIYLKKARNKLLRQKNLLVIGVTGSYGKTTVKNFLEQILIAKYKVIKTPTNINTDIGIAKFIIKNNFSDFNVFIVEMGAYKRGELKIICKMVKPKIGILTVIGDQHLALFGSQENIKLGKYELLDSLPLDGLAITNSDNEYCRQYLLNAKSPIKTFGENQQFSPDCFIKDLVSDNQKINFSVEIKDNEKNKILKISAPIVGQHNSLNIAPAILVGLFLNIKDEDIIKQCAKLELPDKTLQIYNYGKSLIIDDSYNANPQGFLAALKVLDEYQGDWKKIVITRGMLELGEKSQYWHEKIGQVIAQVADELIIISSDSIEPIKKGIGNNKNISVKVELDSDKLLADFQQFKNEKCLILIENRLTVVVTHYPLFAEEN